MVDMFSWLSSDLYNDIRITKYWFDIFWIIWMVVQNWEKICDCESRKSLKNSGSGMEIWRELLIQIKLSTTEWRWIRTNFLVVQDRGKRKWQFINVCMRSSGWTATLRFVRTGFLESEEWPITSDEPYGSQMAEKVWDGRRRRNLRSKRRN
jgi:hypothetical protein